MPFSRISVVAAVLAGILALASTSGAVLFAGGIAIVQIIFAMGVVRASGMRSARPAAWLSLLAGLAALVWIERSGTADLVPVAAVLGPAVLVAIVVQLARRDGRAGLNRELSLFLTACVSTMLPVAWLALHATGSGVHTVGLALLGVGVVSLAEALPISRAVRRVIGVLAATTGAAVLVVVFEGVGGAVPAVSAVVIAAFAGVMAGVGFAIADRLAGEIEPVEAPVLVSVPDDSSPRILDPAGEVLEAEPGREPSPAGPGREAPGSAAIAPLRIAVPFVAAAPAVYVLGQLLVG